MTIKLKSYKEIEQILIEDGYVKFLRKDGYDFKKKNAIFGVSWKYLCGTMVDVMEIQKRNEEIVYKVCELRSDNRIREVFYLPPSFFINLKEKLDKILES